MKKIFVIFAFFTMFFLISCDSAKKFENPYDKNNEETNSNDEDEDQTDSSSEHDDGGNSDSGRKQGELYGDCFDDKTCSGDLICDVENNVCIKNSASEQTADDEEQTTDDTDTASEQVNDNDEQVNDDADTASEQVNEDEELTDNDTDTSDSSADEEPDTEPVSGDTRVFKCFGLPANASWNSVSKITQTFNGEE